MGDGHDELMAHHTLGYDELDLLGMDWAFDVFSSLLLYGLSIIVIPIFVVLREGSPGFGFVLL